MEQYLCLVRSVYSDKILAACRAKALRIDFLSIMDERIDPEYDLDGFGFALVAIGALCDMSRRSYLLNVERREK
jgi:hypothetical protein